MSYPNEFLGRCVTCLGNAYLSSKPCRIGWGQGMPVTENDCLVRRCQKQHDEEQGNAKALR